ncbi:MAG: hypothetical protein HYR85_20010 [Planctomycetes bacterium]|nr:hypothetical protein [Planctomycetota bacterium]MBI3844515.1 hypothetical protein [Planctomycetota bacterium]
MKAFSDPAVMTEAERLTELAAILSRGYLRLAGSRGIDLDAFRERAPSCPHEASNAETARGKDVA